MRVFINNESKEINFSTLGEWAAAEFENFKGIAIAVNNNVVPSSKWSAFALNENDKILIVQAAQGG